MTSAASQGTGSQSGSGYSASGSGSDSGSGYSVSGSGSGSEAGEAMMADGSWLAGLAMGDSPRTLSPSGLQSALLAWIITLSLTLSLRCL